MERSEEVDGQTVRLLYTADIAAIAGWEEATVRHYNSVARKARRLRKDTPHHMPNPARKVRRRLIKANGKPLVVWTPVWRETDILPWLIVKLGSDEALARMAAYPREPTT